MGVEVGCGGDKADDLEDAGGVEVPMGGQLPLRDGSLTATGKIGTQVPADEAAELAVICVLNALAAAGTRRVLLTGTHTFSV